jgi:hypothetical protein
MFRIPSMHPSPAEKVSVFIRLSQRHVLGSKTETIYFVDIVKHDDISRYGKRPRGS